MKGALLLMLVLFSAIAFALVFACDAGDGIEEPEIYDTYETDRADHDECNDTLLLSRNNNVCTHPTDRTVFEFDEIQRINWIEVLYDVENSEKEIAFSVVYEGQEIRSGEAYELDCPSDRDGWCWIGLEVDLNVDEGEFTILLNEDLICANGGTDYLGFVKVEGCEL